MHAHHFRNSLGCSVGRVGCGLHVAHELTRRVAALDAGGTAKVFPVPLPGPAAGHFGFGFRQFVLGFTAAGGPELAPWTRTVMCYIV